MDISNRQLESMSHEDSLVAGVRLRNAESYDDAEAHLIHAYKKNPGHWQAYFELGILYGIRNDAARSFAYFKQALAREGHTVDLIRYALANAVSNNNIKNFESVIEAAILSSESAVDTVCAYRDLLSYASRFDLHHIHQLHDHAVEKSLGWYLLDKIMVEVQHHFQNKLPFALIRLGDGEGTWGHFDIEDEIRFHTMYQANRNEFWNIWFGQNKAEHRDSFFQQMRILEARLEEANIIGIPPKSWITHEYSIGSLRGIPGTANIIRRLSDRNLYDVALCTQLMHYELSHAETFHAFLRSLETVAVITCHPETVDVMKEKFGIPNVVYIPVPGEPSRAAQLGGSSIRGEHYPNHFTSNMALISSMDWTGKVCLVGGGILGKFYCLEIKKNGGIAIDIGSVMDKWNNKKTRPGF